MIPRNSQGISGKAALRREPTIESVIKGLESVRTRVSLKPLINRDYCSRSSRFFFSPLPSAFAHLLSLFSFSSFFLFFPLPFSLPTHPPPQRIGKCMTSNRNSQLILVSSSRLSNKCTVRLNDALEDSFPADRMWVSFIESERQTNVR